MRRYLGSIVAALALLVTTASPTWASEDLLRAARVLYPFHRGSLVVSCTLCHQGAEGGALNVYGKDVQSAGSDRRALLQVDWRDSDRDGVMNIDELRVDSHPADRNDTPTPKELAEVRAAEWPLEMVSYPEFLVDVKRVRSTSAVLSEREEGRVSAALERPLSPYERQPFFVVARTDARGTLRDDLAGAIYVIDATGPSGPMQVAVFLLPNRVVAGVIVMRHNEGGPPAEIPSEVEAQPNEEASGAPPEAIVLPGGLIVRPPRAMPFTSEEALNVFKRWSLDNQEEWAETVQQLQEWDPDGRSVYPVLAHAVATALWLAEETMPRPIIQGAIGAPRRTVN